MDVDDDATTATTATTAMPNAFDAMDVTPPPAIRVRFSTEPPQVENVGYDTRYDDEKMICPAELTAPTEEERRALHVDVVTNTPLYNWGQGKRNTTPSINRESYIDRKNIRAQLMTELHRRTSTHA